MSQFYDRTAATAARLLASYGQPVSITRTSGGTYDPLTGETTGQTATTYTPDGVLLNYGGKEAGELRAAGVDIVSTDKKLLCAAFAVDPVLTDKVTVEGEAWTVMRVKTLSPAGTSVLHELQVRR